MNGIPTRIPEFTEHIRCPKCHVVTDETTPGPTHVKETYHQGPQVYGVMDLPPCGQLVMTFGDELSETVMTDLESHLCRKCALCGFGWVVKSAHVEDIYAPGSETA